MIRTSLLRTLYRLGFWQFGDKYSTWWVPGVRQWRWDFWRARREVERKLRVSCWRSWGRTNVLGLDKPFTAAQAAWHAEWVRLGYPRRDEVRS